MHLKKSAYANEASLENIIKLAQKGRGNDKDGYRAEFIRLVKTYQQSQLEGLSYSED